MDEDSSSVSSDNSLFNDKQPDKHDKDDNDSDDESKDSDSQGKEDDDDDDNKAKNEDDESKDSEFSRSSVEFDDESKDNNQVKDVNEDEESKDDDESKSDEDKDEDNQSKHDEEKDDDNEDKEDDEESKIEAKSEEKENDEHKEGEDEEKKDDEEQKEAEEEPEVIPETVFDVEIPKISADLGKELHFVKLPNFLSVETHPFDPQWYEDEIDEDEIQDEEGRSRLKLKVENTIRWRNVLDKETGETKKESNALMVKWADGSYSLHLGNEIFDVHKLDMMPTDNSHLFIRQGTGLLGQAVFKTKLSFRPYSTDSFTHKKLTLSLADRSQKTQKIRVLPNVGKDPEAHRSEMIKKEEDRLKASIRRENKMRKVRERALTRGPTASYLEPDGEEDDEEEGISIARIKNQYKRPNLYNRYNDSDSGEESKGAHSSRTQNQEDDDDDDSDLVSLFKFKFKVFHNNKSYNKLMNLLFYYRIFLIRAKKLEREKLLKAMKMIRI